MKKALFSLMLSAAALGSVSAADLPKATPNKAQLVTSPSCQWCGLYFQGFVGYGGADFIANFDDSRDFQSLSAKHSSNSVLGGGGVGYNYQFGNLVVGAVTDFMFSGLRHNENGIETTLPWMGTTRLKAGFLLTPDVLVYGSGGVAYGHAKAGDVTTGGLVFTTPTVGWALGGGLDYAITTNVGVGVEYLHVDLDGPSVTNGLQTIGTRIPVDRVTGNVWYRF